MTYQGKILLMTAAVVLGAVIIAALIESPLADLFGRSRAGLRALRNALMQSAENFAGPRFKRFWELRQVEPHQPMAGALDRLSRAVREVGIDTVAQVREIDDTIGWHLSSLKTLGISSPSETAAASQAGSAPSSPSQGGWGLLVVLSGIALAAGIANSFLLNEFFSGMGLSAAPWPVAFPDFRYSQIIATMVFILEIALGLVLHRLAEDKDDESMSRRLIELAPWAFLIGLLLIEGFAYAVLSNNMHLPQRLQIPSTSGMYDLAQYFMAGFGAGITLLLTALGYLIGRTSEGIRRERAAKRSRRTVEAYGSSMRTAKDQAEATSVSVDRLRTAVGDFSPNLQKEFFDATGYKTDAENVALAIGQMAQRLRDQPSKQLPLERGEPGGAVLPVWTRAQVLTDLLIFGVVFAATVVGAWISVEYLAAYAMGLALDTGLILVTSRALIFGIGVTALGFAVGFVLRESVGGSRVGTVTPRLVPRIGANRTIAIAAAAVGLAIAGTLIAAAIASRVAGTAWALSGAFGLLHAVFLVGFGAAIDVALISAAHLLYLAALGGVILIALAVAIVLLGLDVVLAVAMWAVRLLAIFGKMLMPWRRGRTPELSDNQRSPVALPPSAAVPTFGGSAAHEAKVSAGE